MPVNRAKIFISCGQRTIEEKEIGRKIKLMLEEELGYFCFLSIDETRPQGLKETILNELRTSDYFLFIDFRREILIDSTKLLADKEKSAKPVYRGSLFCHQELAIAASLEMPILGFTEKGVQHPDGMSGTWSANHKNFKNRDKLVALIQGEVKGKWRNDHQNRIAFDLNMGDVISLNKVPYYVGEKTLDSYWFHLPVRNYSLYRHAFNCSAYLSRYVKRDDFSNIPGYGAVDLKWSGSISPSINLYKYIPSHPMYSRQLNALFFLENTTRVYLSNIVDGLAYRSDFVSERGVYYLEYTIISENFADTKACFEFTLTDHIETCKLVRIIDDFFDEQ